jgi:hypothetical protein
LIPAKNWELRSLHIALLGRGFLTGQIKKFEDLAEDDLPSFLTKIPGRKFSKKIFHLVKKIEALAQQKRLHAVAVGLLLGCLRKGIISFRYRH